MSEVWRGEQFMTMEDPNDSITTCTYVQSSEYIARMFEHLDGDFIVPKGGGHCPYQPTGSVVGSELTHVISSGGVATSAA